VETGYHLFTEERNGLSGASQQQLTPLNEGVTRMKPNIVRLVLITIVLILSSSVTVLADGGEPVPHCYPVQCLPLAK
jgi:hypothetical protein